MIAAFKDEIFDMTVNFISLIKVHHYNSVSEPVLHSMSLTKIRKHGYYFFSSTTFCEKVDCEIVL